MDSRKAIRSAVKAALVGQTRAEDRIESNRKTPVSQEPSQLLGRNELSRIIVWTRATKSRVFDESPRRYRHETEVIVECFAQLNAGVGIDDDMDDFAEEVLRAVLADDTLGGVSDDLVLDETVSDSVDGGDRIIGFAGLTFTATHYTFAPLPGTGELPDLNTINTQYNLAGAQPDPADRAKSIIEDLQS